MSTRIIDEIRAVKIPQSMHGVSYQQDIYVICELGGDNNVCNARTGRRARSWTAVAIGEPWQVIGEICRYAGSFEGGMTKFSTGRATPEAYIRRCRKVLADADTIGDSVLRLDLRIRFTAKEKETDSAFYYEQLIKAGSKPVQETWYGDQEDVFHFTRADIPTWLKGVHGRAWRNVAVAGPGTV